jgi:hypothetical protein
LIDLDAIHAHSVSLVQLSKLPYLDIGGVVQKQQIRSITEKLGVQTQPMCLHPPTTARV